MLAKLFIVCGSFFFLFMVVSFVYDLFDLDEIFTAKGRQKRLQRKQKKQKELQKERVLELLIKLDNVRGECQYSQQYFKDSLASIYYKYNDICGEDGYTELASNRVNCMLTIIDGYKESDINWQENESVRDVVQVTKQFLSEIRKVQLDNERKIQQEMNAFMDNKVKDFLETSTIMLQDFKQYNQSN
ncbi:hypothetical protein [Clostridium felsineum]|uniref:hypothetical protein n=1 Tax=Clostridium felsineum TaxID=36839 RepID=UPI00098C132D|nr:hypothetical protein [Clostridium felsineum]URZ16919.1 hypothetical protein CLFE_029660 [Clostridium felsineum DSM 794]